MMEAKAGFRFPVSRFGQNAKRITRNLLAAILLIIVFAFLGCLAPEFGEKPCCEMTNATQKGECKLYSGENDTFLSNNDYCGSCTTMYCAYAAFDNSTNETLYVEMQAGWDAPREINCTNMTNEDIANKTHPCNNIGYCLLVNASGYEAYPICTQREPFPWENPNCTSMLCGSIKYRPARSFLPDLTKSIFFQSIEAESTTGLYHATCNFYPLDPKTLRLIRKSKGVFQNTFRFGAGDDISDFEEARWYFPLSDKFTGFQNLFTTNFSRDRFMNYLNLSGALAGSCNEVDLASVTGTQGCIWHEGDPGAVISQSASLNPGDNITGYAMMGCSGSGSHHHEDWEIYIYNPAGTVVASKVGTDPGCADRTEKLTYTAPVAGTYQVYVHSGAHRNYGGEWCSARATITTCPIAAASCSQTIPPAWATKFNMAPGSKYFCPFDPINDFNNYTACAKSGNGAQLPPLANGENYWFKEYSEVEDDYNNITFSYTMPDVEKYKFFLQAAYWGQIYNSTSSGQWTCSTDGSTYTTQAACTPACQPGFSAATRDTLYDKYTWNNGAGSCGAGTTVGTFNCGVEGDILNLGSVPLPTCNCNSWNLGYAYSAAQSDTTPLYQCAYPSAYGTTYKYTTSSCPASISNGPLQGSPQIIAYVSASAASGTQTIYEHHKTVFGDEYEYNNNPAWCGNPCQFVLTGETFQTYTDNGSTPVPGTCSEISGSNRIADFECNDSFDCITLTCSKEDFGYERGLCEKTDGTYANCLCHEVGTRMLTDNEVWCEPYKDSATFTPLSSTTRVADISRAAQFCAAPGIPYEYNGNTYEYEAYIPVTALESWQISGSECCLDTPGFRSIVCSNDTPLGQACGNVYVTVPGLCAEEANYSGGCTVCNRTSCDTSPPQPESKLRGTIESSDVDFQCCNESSCETPSSWFTCANDGDPCTVCPPDQGCWEGNCTSVLHESYCCSNEVYEYPVETPPDCDTVPAEINFTYKAACVPSVACETGSTNCSISEPNSNITFLLYPSQLCCGETNYYAGLGTLYDECVNVSVGSSCSNHRLVTSSSDQALLCRYVETSLNSPPPPDPKIYFGCSVGEPPDGTCGTTVSAGRTWVLGSPVAPPPIKFIVSESPYDLGYTSSTDWGGYIGYSFADDFPDSMFAQECDLTPVDYDVEEKEPPYPIETLWDELACIDSFSYYTDTWWSSYESGEMCDKSYSYVYKIKSLGNCAPDDGLEGETMMNVSSFPKIPEVYGWCEGSTFDTFVGVDLDDAYSKLDGYTFGCPSTTDGMDLGFFASLFGPLFGSCNDGEYGPVVGISDDFCGPKIRAYVADIEALRDRVDHYLKSGVMPVVWYTSAEPYAHTKSGSYTVIDDCVEVGDTDNTHQIQEDVNAAVTSILTGSYFYYVPDQEGFFSDVPQACTADCDDNACHYSDKCPLIEATKKTNGVGGESYVSKKETADLGKQYSLCGGGTCGWVCDIFGGGGANDVKCDWEADYPFLERTIGNSASFVITDIDYPDCARVDQLKKQCPRCLFAMKLDDINALLSYEDLTVQTGFYCYDAFVFDFEANKLYIPQNATTTEMYYSIFTNMSETSRLILQKTGRPSLVLLTIDENNPLWGNYNDTFGFMRYAYKNQSDLVNSGIFGIMYKEWAGGAKALVDQRASSTKDDKFCAFEQATNLYLNPLEKMTVYIRMDTKDNFTDNSGAQITAPLCVECNDLEKTTGQCSRTCLNMVTIPVSGSDWMCPADGQSYADQATCDSSCYGSGVPAGLVPVHRAFTAVHYINDHLYTLSLPETSSSGYYYGPPTPPYDTAWNYHLEFESYYYLNSSQAPGTVPFYRCFNGFDKGGSLSTTDPNCEFMGSSALVGQLGYIATSQLPGTVPLYRYVTDNAFWQYPPGMDRHYFQYGSSPYEPFVNNYTYEGIVGYVWIPVATPVPCNPVDTTFGPLNCTLNPAIANDSQRCPMEAVDNANNTCVLCTDLVNASQFNKVIECNITYLDGSNKTFTISDPENVTLYPDAVSVLPKGQKCCFVDFLEPPCCNGTVPISVNYSSCGGACTPYECGVGNANEAECEKYYIAYEDGKYADCGWDSTAGQCTDYGENNKIYCIPRVDGRCANELIYTYTSMTADTLVVTPVIFPHSGDPLADCGMADSGGVFCGRETPVKNYKLVCGLR